jgi:hypothetical protein
MTVLRVIAAAPHLEFTRTSDLKVVRLRLSGPEAASNRRAGNYKAGNYEAGNYEAGNYEAGEQH